ncbi:MAG: hypothetical protein K6G10_01540 [Butyrivibrio sp.]|nr:hypothetical protein [Butyrivibrio sp.]
MENAVVNKTPADTVGPNETNMFRLIAVPVFGLIVFTVAFALICKYISIRYGLGLPV